MGWTVNQTKNWFQRQRSTWPRTVTLLLLVASGFSPALARESASQLPLATAPHWAFIPPARGLVPVVDEKTANPIDGFIRAKLAELKIKQVGPATKSELLRRVTYDLTGLPPSLADLADFLGDDSSEAWDRVVDRLLASPGYGERWAQHWLDLAHYADSNGFELDADRPDSWRYRDWVIQALNSDMPYDRFVTLQVAGDESAPGNREALIASGFGRSGPREVVSGNIDPEVRRQNELVEATTTVGSVFLGLTIGCARCHDHKFDPLPTTDYYRLQAFFAGTQLRDIPIHEKSDKERYDRAMEKIQAQVKPIEESKKNLEAPFREQILKRKEAGLTEREREIRTKPKGDRTPEEDRLFAGIGVALKVDWEEIAADVARDPVAHEKRESLKRQIYELQRQSPMPPAEAMAMVEEAGERPETWVLARGSTKNKHHKVAAGPPEVLIKGMGSEESFQPPTAPIDEAHSGLRLALAKWLVATNNPLTARVIVNRMWQHHFGRGLVSTTSDFGTRGERPGNQALLDFLATELMRNGWHLKPIHRLMLTSGTYQLSSTSNQSTGVELDPENRFSWRMNRKRMDAEGLRDAILAVSGGINRKAAGPGVLIDLEPGVRSLIFTEQEVVELWPVNPNVGERCRRSIYIYRKRNVRYPLFDAFDAPDALTPCPVRALSTQAPQALVLFNSGFAQESARRFASDLLTIRDQGSRVNEAFRRCFARSPSPDEMKEAERFISSSTGSKLQCWSDFTLALLNSNEFIYVP